MPESNVQAMSLDPAGNLWARHAAVRHFSPAMFSGAHGISFRTAARRQDSTLVS